MNDVAKATATGIGRQWQVMMPAVLLGLCFRTAATATCNGFEIPDSKTCAALNDAPKRCDSFFCGSEWCLGGMSSFRRPPEQRLEWGLARRMPRERSRFEETPQELRYNFKTGAQVLTAVKLWHIPGNDLWVCVKEFKLPQKESIVSNLVSELW